MYICVCNGLNEKACKKAIADGCKRPAEIYAYHECAPQCGKCAKDMAEMIKAAKTEAVSGQVFPSRPRLYIVPTNAFPGSSSGSFPNPA